MEWRDVVVVDAARRLEYCWSQAGRNAVGGTAAVIVSEYVNMR